MEPRDLSSSARLFPNAQIKIRWVFKKGHANIKIYPLNSHSQHISDNIANVKFIIAHPCQFWITKSRIIVDRCRLYSYKTNYRDTLRCSSESIHGTGSYRCGWNNLHIIVGNTNQVWDLQYMLIDNFNYISINFLILSRFIDIPSHDLRNFLMEVFPSS